MSLKWKVLLWLSRGGIDFSRWNHEYSQGMSVNIWRFRLSYIHQKKDYGW